MNAPVETKVVAAVIGAVSPAGLVALVFGLAAQYHWFTPPAPYLTALTVTVVSGLLSAYAGWKAPHTSRLKPLSQAQADLLDQAAALAHPVQVPPVMNVSATPPAQPAAGGTP